MSVTGNGAQKEFKLNLQYNTTYPVKIYKIILSGKLTTCFCLTLSLSIRYSPHEEEDLLYHFQY